MKVEGAMSNKDILNIHGCMDELLDESTWVVTNWDGEVLCRCFSPMVAKMIARSLNQYTVGGA